MEKHFQLKISVSAQEVSLKKGWRGGWGEGSASPQMHPQNILRVIFWCRVHKSLGPYVHRIWGVMFTIALVSCGHICWKVSNSNPIDMSVHDSNVECFYSKKCGGVLRCFDTSTLHSTSASLKFPGVAVFVYRRSHTPKITWLHEVAWGGAIRLSLYNGLKSHPEAWCNGIGTSNLMQSL